MVNIEKRKNEQKTSAEENDSLSTLLATPEGRILRAGLILAFLGIIGLISVISWNPELSQVLIAMSATNILFGRAAGMSIGYSMGLRHVAVIPITILVETVLVLLFYPLFVFSWRRLIVIGVLRKFMKRTEKAADKRKGTIRKYGILGLFMFVWFPFWMTGPVIGCAIGFILGFRARFTLTVVISGTSLAIFCWAFFLKELHERIALYNPYAPLILTAIVMLLAVFGFFLHELRRGNKKK
ncbi:small multi-drug export protein [Candidatus Latescibacterota bacterium]